MTAPRWHRALATALSEHPTATTLQLASIDPTSPMPHVRTLICRDFCGPSTNPGQPLLIMTTDSRSPKTTQLISNPHVQLAWWIQETKEQFRISGLASIIPSPSNKLYKHFLHITKTASTKSGLGVMQQQGFDWEDKRKVVFKGMSPFMKATWVRPPPGSRLEGGEEVAERWPVKLEEPDENGIFKTDEDKILWESALGNFALLVVDPVDVDYVELGPVPNRRTKFWRSDRGQWQDEALVP